METDKLKKIYRSLRSFAKALEDDDVAFGAYIVGVKNDDGTDMVTYLKTGKQERDEQLSHLARQITRDKTLMRAIINELMENDDYLVSQAAKVIRGNLEFGPY